MTPLTNPITFSTTQKALSKFPSEKPTTQAQAQAQTQWPEMLTATEYSNHQGRLPEWTQIEQATPRVLTILCGGGTAARLGKSLNALHGVRAPSISIPKYLERIYKYTNCSPSCFVVGYVYIDRLSHRHPDSLVVS
ncbi:hypothetical protein JRO89_XS01G0148700 [Xanthoceras sorbifolium]|uniref:Uncharacterized protein n=1 Tax=Xanthoceras sorbifolium TaxID=99658 RepID=A0ABQ8IJD9_9ROSI|nr:hypothetical protein JRO89_XS01G0148700 [Xanthoceras sorbifolium]